MHKLLLHTVQDVVFLAMLFQTLSVAMQLCYATVVCQLDLCQPVHCQTVCQLGHLLLILGYKVNQTVVRCLRT